MKKIIYSLMAAMAAGWAGFARAQDDMNSIPKQTIKKAVIVSRAQKITNRINDQTLQIQQGVAGKIINKAEAKKYTAKLAAIRAQFKKYLRKNGKKKDLTEEQASKLNQMLSQNSSAIKGEDVKEEGDPAAKPGSGM